MRRFALRLTAVAGFCAAKAAAFTCTWRGGDYSWYTFRQDLPNYCCRDAGNCPTGYTQTGFCGNEFYEICNNCGTGDTNVCCEDPFSKQYERETKTQCCQCAGDTVYNPFTNDNYVLLATDCAATAVPDASPWPDSIGEIQGCDGFDPEILDSEAAAQARAPGEWFTSPEQLDAYLAQTITCQDDCWEMPAVVKSANTADPGPYCRYTWAAGCDNTLVTTNAKDRCGNEKTSTFRVRYDNVAPVVNVTLGAFTESKIKTGWETLALGVTIQEACDPNPLTSIEVFSDEVPLTDKNEKSAVLGRTYATTAVGAPITGWTLTLNRKYTWKDALANKEFATPAVDGRVYTVRVCAQDLAGNIGCGEASVKVPPKGMGTHKIIQTPVNNGKIYNVAEDLVYWNKHQDDMPFRLKNTGLQTAA